MNRPWRARVLAGVLGVVLGTAVVAPALAGAEEDAHKVLVIAAPHLTWDIVRTERPPNLMELLDRSSVASLSVRTVGPRTTPGAAYLSLGAGNRSATARMGQWCSTSVPQHGPAAPSAM